MYRISYIQAKGHLFMILFLMFLLTPALQATNHIIKFGGTQGLNYSPAELSVAVGDTVTWEGSFSSHPLSSTEVPPGASDFFNGSGTSFSYTVSLPGTYNYQCDSHVNAGMTGSFSATVSSLEDDLYGEIPADFRLDQNYPNPFNPATVISWQLAEGSYVDLSVYNLLGEKIATIVSERLPAGRHQISWNAGQNPSGVYYYQIQAGTYRDVKRMFLLR